jgi:hypothetical protein
MEELVMMLAQQMPYPLGDHTYYHDMDIRLFSCPDPASISTDTKDVDIPYYTS